MFIYTCGRVNQVERITEQLAHVWTNMYTTWGLPPSRTYIQASNETHLCFYSLCRKKRERWMSPHILISPLRRGVPDSVPRDRQRLTDGEERKKRTQERRRRQVKRRGGRDYKKGAGWEMGRWGKGEKGNDQRIQGPRVWGKETRNKCERKANQEKKRKGYEWKMEKDNWGEEEKSKGSKKKEQQKIKELTIKEKIITKDNKGKQVKVEYEQGHPRR